MTSADWTSHGGDICKILFENGFDFKKAVKVAKDKLGLSVSVREIKGYLKEKIPNVGSPKQEEPYLYDRAFSTTVELPAPKNGTVVWLSDVHVPFHHKRLCDIALKVIQKIRPDYVVLGGDIFDFYMGSDFEREPTRYKMNLQYEFDEGRYIFEEIVKYAKSTHFILGNHEDRMTRHLFRNPGLWGLRSLNLTQAAELPKQVKVHPYLTKLKIGDLSYHHGADPGKQRIVLPTYLAAAAWRKHGRSIILGHHHRPDSYFIRQNGMDYQVTVTGTMADPALLRYQDEPNWGLGFAIINYSSGIDKASIFSVDQALYRHGAVIALGETYR